VVCSSLPPFFFLPFPFDRANAFLDRPLSPLSPRQIGGGYRLLLFPFFLSSVREEDKQPISSGHGLTDDETGSPPPPDLVDRESR